MNRPSDHDSRAIRARRYFGAVVLAAVSSLTACNKSTTVESSSTTRTESPIAVYRALYDAYQRNDLEGIKSRLSEGTLRMFEKRAQAEGTTLNDGQNSVALIKKTLYMPNKMPDLSNEKITGDTATIGVSNTPGGSPVPTPFVKENGQWKLALDKFF